MTDRNYEIAVTAAAIVLLVVCWTVTLGLLVFDIVLLIQHFTFVPCVFAFSCAWFSFMFFVLGKSNQNTKAVVVNQEHAERVGRWSQLGAVVEGLPESYGLVNIAPLRGDLTEGSGGFWIIRNFENPYRWQLIGQVGPEVTPDALKEALKALNFPLSELGKRRQQRDSEMTSTPGGDAPTGA